MARSGFVSNVLVVIFAFSFLIFILSGGTGTIFGLTQISLNLVQFLARLPTFAWVIVGFLALLYLIKGK